MLDHHATQTTADLGARPDPVIPVLWQLQVSHGTAHSSWRSSSTNSSGLTSDAPSTTSCFPTRDW